jgi:guanine nucleotide-binding protein alpha-1 subunit
MVWCESEPEDPFRYLLAPPWDETPEQRELRLYKEAEARRISDEIDERIRKERDAVRDAHVLKILLLGQSGSGKFSLSFLGCMSHSITII